jgi:peptidyl-dipeptidase A
MNVNYQGALLTLLAVCCLSCQNSQTSSGKIREVGQFLDNYTDTFLRLRIASAEAEWLSNTMIIPGDTSISAEVEGANNALAAFTGNAYNIDKSKEYLGNPKSLTDTRERMLHSILYAAGNNPATRREVVEQRIEVENRQTELLYGYTYLVDSLEVSTGDIDEALRTKTEIAERLKWWEASKEVGKTLNTGLLRLRNLRNQSVQGLDFKNYFQYQVSEYGMSSEEMMTFLEQMISEVWPLYRELHTWVRYELAERYDAPQVPEMIPAHWLPNRWGQDWSALVEVEGINLDQELQNHDASWIIHQGEEFYKSIGFNELPRSFYEKSSLYPLPPESDHKKNNHASAWHIDLQQDVRCLMSVVPSAEYYETVHHELGHIYYYLTYSHPKVPILLRQGANRAFHEAIGSLMGLAALQRPFLVSRGLVKNNIQPDSLTRQKQLLKEALNYIVFIPFSAGVMSHFENTLYSTSIDTADFNEEWWKLKKQYQGIVPPYERGSIYNDATTKTHINDDAAQYYDYALSFALLFQLHQHIAENILHQNPHATNYFGSKETGDFLKNLMESGADNDWRKLVEDNLGSKLSAQAMVDYFQPLMDYLKKVNEGREYTLPVRVL